MERTSRNEIGLSVLRGTELGLAYFEERNWVDRTSRNETRLSVLRGTELV